MFGMVKGILKRRFKYKGVDFSKIEGKSAVVKALEKLDTKKHICGKVLLKYVKLWQWTQWLNLKVKESTITVQTHIWAQAMKTLKNLRVKKIIANTKAKQRWIGPYFIKLYYQISNML